MTLVQDSWFPCIYPISSTPYADSKGHLWLVRRFLEGGARLVQVREKNWSDLTFLRKLRPIVRECRQAGAQVIVNDRVTVARDSGADGVHLGQGDTSTREARQILGARAIIGLSTHTPQQFEEACRLDEISYVALGPVFPTSTKPEADPVVGIDLLRRLAAQTSLPVVAIGGVNLKNAASLWTAGASSLAVISDVCGTPDPAHQVRSYLQLRKEMYGRS